MTVWIVVVLLMAGVITLGYFQGAIRGAMMLLGLLLGALLSIPTAGFATWFLEIEWFGLEKWALMDYVSPTIMLLLYVGLFSGLGFLVSSKVSTHFQYRYEEAEFYRWERMVKHLGICIGALNGVVAVFLLCTGLYVTGYASVQLGGSNEDPWYVTFTKSAAEDLESTGFSKALAPFVPVDEMYFKKLDLLGMLYHNHKLKERISRYPKLMPLTENSEFNNNDFQSEWQSKTPIMTFAKNEIVKSTFLDEGYNNQMMGILGEDLDDFLEYLETGKSPKYAEFLLVDQWDFNLAAAYYLKKRIKPNMTIQEKAYALHLYRTLWEGATLTAFLDETVVIKNKNESGRSQTLRGKWKKARANKYLVNVRDLEFETLVLTNRLEVTAPKQALMFDRFDH